MPDQLYPADALDDSLETHLARYARAGRGVYFATLTLVIAAATALPVVKVNVTVRSPGIIRPATEKQEIHALVSGLAAQVLVRDNQTVAQGDTIVLLHATALDDRAALLAARVLEKQGLLADLTLLLSRSDPALHTADYQREYRQFVTEVRDNRLAQERARRETARVRDLYRTQATTASDLEDVVDFQLEVGQTGKIRITIERLLFVPLLDFGELDNLVGNFIRENADGMPGGQPKLWIIPIAGKSRITPESIFDRLLLRRWVHASRTSLNEPIELTPSAIFPAKLRNG